MYRALYVAAGKRGKKSQVAASNCNNSSSHPYVTDRLSKTSFLVDTGADVYPRSRLRGRWTHSSYELFAANVTTVRKYGCITLRQDYTLRREFSWRFVVADLNGQLIKPSLCDRSAHQDELPGRNRCRCLSPFPSAITSDTFQLRVVCS